MRGHKPNVAANDDETSIQHGDTGHLAVNNTRLRRLLTLLALQTTARCYRRDGPCIPISKGLIVKTGPFVHLTEGATLAFVSSKTSLPVPRVYRSFVRKYRAFVVMERIKGEPLASAWKSLSDEQRQNVLGQLKRMVEELRALAPPPDAGVESCRGGSLRDSRIPRSRPRLGPFRSTQEFHSWLREDLRPGEHPNRKDEDWREIKDMVAMQDGPWPPPVFTHGDLNPFDILVRGDLVVGVIDWEFAGWYPYYWEYTAAWYGNLTRRAWQDVVGDFLEPYPAELKMEITRQKWWGEY